jgi:D-sedoheptulose 7-phosphate isomerase
MEWLKQLVRRYPELDICLPDIQAAIKLLSTCFSSGGKLLVCGNGGSAADSDHIVGELMKGYMSKRPMPRSQQLNFRKLIFPDGELLASHLQGALPAISLVSQTALISAFSNDVSADLVYAQQVYGYGKPGDVLWGISTSGNARNVLMAMQTAKAMRLHTLGLSGPDGGKLKTFSDVMIRVPGENTPLIQERHLPIYHTICAMLETAIFPDMDE